MRVLATLLLGGMIVGPAPSAATGVEAGSPYEILAQRFFESGEELARVMRKLPLNCSALGVVVFSSNATARSGSTRPQSSRPPLPSACRCIGSAPV